MATIVSCPNCREQVTLPPEPYSGLVCPHCQAEFSMQPMLRRSGGALLRDEIVEEARHSFQPPRRTARSRRPLETLEIEPLAERFRPPRAGGGFLGLVGHFIGLLAGGALGLAAGYYLLNWFGGPHFDVLQIPLPGIPHTQKAENAGPATAIQKSQETKLRQLPAEFSKAAPPVKPVGQSSSTQLKLNAAPSPPAPSPSHIRPVGARPQLMLPQPAYSAEDLSLALAAAHEAVGCSACKSTGFVIRTVSGRAAPRLPCTACRGHGSGNITPAAYAKLCHLAEAVTHVEAGQEAAVLAQREVRDTFLKAADRPDKQASIGRQSSQRIANASRTTDGVLLAGTITEKGLQGRYHLTRLVLLGHPTQVNVLSSQAIPFQPGERVAIAGCIVQQPATELEDYRGDNGPIVWGALPLRLGD